ncbi:MAG: hypothetical protein J6W67_02910 [Lentisphaeria bacterium]|nr:hypothetical protein [Lentisphaeria bacterium]
MNTFITSCPHCKTQLQVPTAGVGATISCPACSNSFTIMHPEKKSHKTSKPSGKLLIVISSIVVISLCTFATLAYIIESNRRLDKRVMENMAYQYSHLNHRDIEIFVRHYRRPFRTWSLRRWVKWWQHYRDDYEREKSELEEIYEKYK